MCGIAGFFNYKTKNIPKDGHVLSVLKTMHYRGPDHIGVFSDNDLTFGNARLSIQGVTKEGNQPIYNENKSIVAVYNGEIYNFPELKKDLQAKGHVFRSETDGEILVHLYEEFGQGMACHLNGMFAFALFDIKKRQLILARDRTAQKPLYIHDSRDGIFFCSELKAMLPYLKSVSLNTASVGTFLDLGYFLEPATIINEVSTLEPGSLHAYRYSGEAVQNFWNLAANDGPVIDDLDAWKDQADFIFKNSVKRHLISDVPLTLFLSGGVDSSLLSCYLRGENKIQDAYTGSFVDQKEHDEYDYAFRLGEYCGFNVKRVCLGNQYLADNLEEYLSRASMPQGDCSGIAVYCLAKAVSKEYRVVLGGDGGDELFGGYPTYTLPYLAKKYSLIPKQAISMGRYLSSLVFSRNKYLSLPFKLQQLSGAWGKGTPRAHMLLKKFLPDALAAEILSRSFLEDNIPKGEAHAIFESLYDNSHFSDTIHKLCWVDFNTFLRSCTIPKVERNTMLWSVEARFPFLDNEIVDLSMRTHPDLMVHKRSTKICLRSLLQDKLKGKVVLNLKKQGFTPPVAMMLEKQLSSWREHWFNSNTPFLKPDTFRILHKWRRKGWDLHRLEWNICTLSDWCYRNNISG